jgi:hypothetical protein
MIPPDFFRQFIVVIFFLILILIIILVLYHNTMRKIVVLTDELVREQMKTKELPQTDILPLFNDYESSIITEEILNDNLIETYILYIYFENLYGNELWLSNFNTPKNIIRREGNRSNKQSSQSNKQSSQNSFKISYKPNLNQLIITIPIKKLGIHSSSLSEEQLGLNYSEESVIINGIKMQKWLQIAVSINGRDVDIYIDKQLRKSQLLDNVPILNNNKIIVGEKYKNANCYIGKIEYSPFILSTTELKALYIRNIKFLNVQPILRDYIYFNNQVIKESIYSPSI